MPGDLTNSKLLTSELCFTLLRLFSAIAGIVVTLIFKAEYYYDLHSIDGSSRPVHISNGFHVFCSGILAVSSAGSSANTWKKQTSSGGDSKRHIYYLSRLAPHSSDPFSFDIHTGRNRVAYISYDFLVTYNSIDAISNYTPIILSGVFSLCLLAVDLLALWSIRSDLPLRKVWLINAKDAMVGRIPASGSHRLTWNGHARSPPRSKVYGAVLSAPARRFFMRLLFRRVSPAETRPYAFVRNVFAIFSIAAIIWRAVTAFSQAQNGFETRMVFRRCPETRYATSLHVLIKTPLEPGWTRPNVTITASAARPGVLEDLCTLLDGPTTFDDALEKVFTIFNCPLDPQPPIRATRFNIRVQYWNTPSIRSKVWLSNSMDSFKRSPPRELEGLSLQLTPAGRLEPGFHLDADAGFITRRYVGSSLFNDVILQRQTMYKELSVYPLSEHNRDCSIERQQNSYRFHFHVLSRKAGNF
ncbi:hypothetical protein BDV93DRAFT_542630 [Ceratobasidium sp. AG-I]|nr:hypothetical protein BDV93DRAFT_542630 [Ceratobasidium sp. AG-I]